MSTPTLQSQHELQAFQCLTHLQHYIAQQPIGFAPFTSSSPEYLRFRNAMGITAGGPLRSPARLRQLFASPHIHFTNCTAAVLSNLIVNGFYTFDIDQDKLESCIPFLSTTNKSIRATSLSSASASSFLRLVPIHIYRSICLYLGTSRPWIEPPQILESPPLATSGLSDLELSHRAFSFHRDIDSLISLKVFINLSSTTGGSHEYIKASSYTMNRNLSRQSPRLNSTPFHAQHSASTLYESFLHSGRFSAKSIFSLYGSSNLIQFPTTFGSSWVEDTYGLHRGNPPLKGTRRLVVINFLSHRIRT